MALFIFLKILITLKMSERIIPNVNPNILDTTILLFKDEIITYYDLFRISIAVMWLCQCYFNVQL